MVIYSLHEKFEAFDGAPVVSRRGFFTAIGAAVAATKSDGIQLPSDACILCGFDHDLKPWGSYRAMRCIDSSGCQCRQINALLGMRTPWQKRTSIVKAKGVRR